MSQGYDVAVLGHWDCGDRYIDTTLQTVEPTRVGQAGEVAASVSTDGALDVSSSDTIGMLGDVRDHLGGTVAKTSRHAGFLSVDCGDLERRTVE